MEGGISEAAALLVERCLGPSPTPPHGAASIAAAEQLLAQHSAAHASLVLRLDERCELCSGNLLATADVQPMDLRLAGCRLSSQAMSAGSSVQAAVSSTSKLLDVAAAAAAEPPCRHLVAVPLRLGECGRCWGALLLGTPAAGSAASLAALAASLGAALEASHRAQLLDVADLVQRLLLGTPAVRLGGYGSAAAAAADDQLSGSSDEVDSTGAEISSEQEAGEERRAELEQRQAEAAGRGAVPGASSGGGSQWPPLALQFKEGELEDGFRTFHARLMRKVDLVLHAAIELTTLLVELLRWRSTAWGLPWLVPQLARMTCVSLPLVLAPRAYERHRTRFLLAMYAYMCFHVGRLSRLGSVEAMMQQDAIFAAMPNFLLSLAFVTVFPLVFQMRLSALLPAHAALFATSARLLPAICAYTSPGVPPAACARAMFPRVLLRAALLPLGIVYLSELAARKLFLATRR